MNNLAKEINELLLSHECIKEYLSLKSEIDNDKELVLIRNKLNVLKKTVCSKGDSSEYYSLLDLYNKDVRVSRYLSLKKEIEEYFLEISDILFLK